MSWIWRLLGWHVCEEFTRWETHRADYSRPRTWEDHVVGEVETIDFTRRWQERACTTCGKIQQRSLDR